MIDPFYQVKIFNYAMVGCIFLYLFHNLTMLFFVVGVMLIDSEEPIVISSILRSTGGLVS